MEGIVHEHDGESHIDDWGVTWVREGGFNQATKFPLANASRDDVLAYKFPWGRVDDLVGLMEPVVAERKDFYIGVDVSPCAFEMYNRLRGMEPALLDLAADPDLARTMHERCADFIVALSEKSCDRYDLDWLWTGDDVAGQHGMMMSPELWRDLIRPSMQRIIDVGRDRDLTIAYHSCGAIRPIIGDLIEMGVNVLNPIQAGCPGMDAKSLKEEFGADLTFMGGVDTQGILPNGTEDEVRRATTDLLEIMTSDGGGFIMAASHTVPPETPDENVFAMYDEAGISKEEIFDRAATIRST
jgi:uroporphyrinogen decarboxylase